MKLGSLISQHDSGGDGGRHWRPAEAIAAWPRTLAGTTACRGLCVGQLGDYGGDGRTTLSGGDGRAGGRLCRGRQMSEMAVWRDSCTATKKATLGRPVTRDGKAEEKGGERRTTLARASVRAFWLPNIATVVCDSAARRGPLLLHGWRAPWHCDKS